MLSRLLWGFEKYLSNYFLNKKIRVCMFCLIFFLICSDIIKINDDFRIF